MKKKILIIDDEVDFVMVLSWLLRRAGYEVYCHDRGGGAVDAIRHLQPDLILLDINLPEISGIEIYKLLRVDQGVSRIPVIFLSALCEKEVYCLGVLKAAGFLKKPCESDLILQTIEKVLSSLVLFSHEQS